MLKSYFAAIKQVYRVDCKPAELISAFSNHQSFWFEVKTHYIVLRAIFKKENTEDIHDFFTQIFTSIFSVYRWTTVLAL